MDTQRVVQRLSAARNAALSGNWSVVQEECRCILEAIAKDPRYAGVIQYERLHGTHQIRVQHAHYHTWEFHFRWIEDAFEYLQLLQELGYEWESEEMSEDFYQRLQAELANTETQAERAEWLERIAMQ